MKFEIPYYNDFISSELANFLLSSAKPVQGIDDLDEVGSGGGLETPEALHFLCDLYRDLESDLKKILSQRVMDRKFIDERVKACFEFNKNLKHDFGSFEYKTILGMEDAFGRIVVGPQTNEYCQRRPDKPIAVVPEFLRGSHVTLFGPPDSAKMAINAMNAYHRKLKDEPAVVEALLDIQENVPKWGADDEDSKTPLRADLVSAAVNLTACFDESLSFIENSKKYELANDNLSLPIKRFPGLALPCSFLFYKRSPLPLHLYDFALHLFKNWQNPKALVFYVPKLENEEEARYIHKMISLAEAKIKTLHHDYELGTVRLMVVLENPRAILRTHEIMDELYPYFVGASLGWHDYLASTARLFKEDGNYRIPVKADPDIVIKYIKASHHLLADVVGSRGGIKVGGMYGILPLDTNLHSESFQITMKGYIKDVITQMKRQLTGFWVAHPDFVRLGLALVEAWRFYSEGKPKLLTELVERLLDQKYHKEVLDFIEKPDIEGLDLNDPQYVRSLLVADIKESDFIANNDPEEIRYNVFQTLQYLTDWLCGNGCVALPAHIHGVAVRVMDDLATAERSRWEVWHEIYHGRFKLEDFLKIAFEEYHAIRKDQEQTNKAGVPKIIQVKWNTLTQKWYPVAFRLMIQMMTQKKPVEFITELLLPFTVEAVRVADDPFKKIMEIDSKKYRLDAYTERYLNYFEICGCSRFATEMAKLLTLDLERVRSLILNFSKAEVIEAANFHGNIGEDKKTLDPRAQNEQALVNAETANLRKQLLERGEAYLRQFDMKFLISAKSKTGIELLSALTERLLNTENQELENARKALWEISFKRLTEGFSKEEPEKYPETFLGTLKEKIEDLRQEHQIQGLSLAINVKGCIQDLAYGECSTSTWFELASLSKTLAAAFAIEYFKNKKISLKTSVNELLQQTASKFRLASDQVMLKHLMSHSALGMHYVKGYPLSAKKIKLEGFLPEIDVICEPGTEFHYSGGGFIVLEHIIEALEKKSIQSITKNFFESINELSFEQMNLSGVSYAKGYFDDGTMVPGSRLVFPAFAAGAMGSARGMAQFLNDLTTAYHKIEGSPKISHDTAVQMLACQDVGPDKGSREFMGCDIGLGVFIVEAGDNKLAVHQGANEGFRCLYIHCFSGPDCGQGFVLLCNSDDKAILFISEVTQLILKEMRVSGIDFTKFNAHFDLKNITPENRVNQIYKKLIFDAFLPLNAEPILNKGPMEVLAPYNILTQAEIKKVSNQKFARAENLISSFLPVYDPLLFGQQGKIMDSWESARHNPYEFDFIELKLAQPSPLRYVSLSTQYHDGNQAEFVRVLARSSLNSEWNEILPKQKMEGHSFLNLTLNPTTEIYSDIRVEMYPDGGLTRLGLYNELPQNENIRFSMQTCERFKNEIPKVSKPLIIKYEPTILGIKHNKERAHINLAGLAFGAKILVASNEHYSPAVQLLSPYPAIHMFDGFESARSRQKDNFEDVTIELAEASQIKRIILDFEFFINNNPREVSIQGLSQNEWQTLVAKTNVKAYAGNKIEFKIQDSSIYTQVKIQIYPDGGINRLFVFAD